MGHGSGSAHVCGEKHGQEKGSGDCPICLAIEIAMGVPIISNTPHGALMAMGNTPKASVKMMPSMITSLWGFF